MLPGVDFTEMILLAVVAMVLLGPRDLPLMMRKIGRFTGKMRALAFEFKQGFDELGRQAELEELRKEVADLKKHTGIEDLQKEFAEDEANLKKDVDSAMAPVSLPDPGPDPGPGPGEEQPGSKDAHPPPAPAHPAAAANGSVQPAPPPVAPYAGLSADHPGYDAGDDFRIDGRPAEPSGVSGEAEPASRPAKQDAPA